MDGQAALHLFQRRLGVVSEQFGGCHHHAGGAISALRSLFRDERGLNTTGILLSAQSLNGGNFPAYDSGYRSGAGTRSLSIDQNGARTALAQSATKLRAVQIEIVAQDVKYRLIRVPRIDADCLAIHPKFVGCHKFHYVNCWQSYNFFSGQQKQTVQRASGSKAGYHGDGNFPPITNDEIE
jgi:hypothetical protein